MSARNGNQTTTAKPGKPTSNYSFGATQTGSWGFNIGLAGGAAIGGAVASTYSTAITELYA